MSLEIESMESFGKLIANFINEKFGTLPTEPSEPQGKPPKALTLSSHNSWGQFIEFDDEGQAKPTTPTKTPGFPSVSSSKTVKNGKNKGSTAPKRNSLERWLKKAASYPTIRCSNCEAILKPNETSTHWCAHAEGVPVRPPPPTKNKEVSNANGKSERKINACESNRATEKSQHMRCSSSPTKQSSEEDYFCFLPESNDFNECEEDGESCESREIEENLEKKESPTSNSILKYEDIDPWTALALDKTLVNKPDFTKPNQVISNDFKKDVKTTNQEEKTLFPSQNVLDQNKISDLIAFPFENAPSADISQANKEEKNRPRSMTMPNSCDNERHASAVSRGDGKKQHSDSIDAAMFYSNFGPAP